MAVRKKQICFAIHQYGRSRSTSSSFLRRGLERCTRICNVHSPTRSANKNLGGGLHRHSGWSWASANKCCNQPSMSPKTSAAPRASLPFFFLKGCTTVAPPTGWLTFQNVPCASCEQIFAADRRRARFQPSSGCCRGPRRSSAGRCETPVPLTIFIKV